MSFAEATSPGWQARTRLELARGHWSLGERAEALTCLERLADADPAAEGLSELLEDLHAELAGGDEPELGARLAALAKRVRRPEPELPAVGSPLATGTLAGLFVEQGYSAQGMKLAQDVLRERPEDARARAVYEQVRGGQREAVLARLERWLVQIQRLRRGEVQA